MRDRTARFQSFLRRYTIAAVITTNTIVLFAVLNLVLLGAFAVRDALLPRAQPDRGNLVTRKYGRPLTTLYPGMTEHEIDTMLTETWRRSFVYEPFTQFKEGPFAGKYLNISPHGFRRTVPQGPWPPDSTTYAVFLFGGSTTYGYGVPDDQTIASHLQRLLGKVDGRPVQVYNFGRGSYYSTQERVLFEQLLTAGVAPRVAVFIDGLNDFGQAVDSPFLTDRWRQFVDGRAPRPPPSLLVKLPAYQAAQALRTRLARLHQPDTPRATQTSDEGAYDRPEMFDQVIARYQRNKRIVEAVASAYGVTAVFRLAARADVQVRPTVSWPGKHEVSCRTRR